MGALEIPLIKDAAYTAIRFEGTPVPSCLALDIQARGHIDATRTIYVGTFSKTIAPGLRVGWLCAARDLIDKVVLTKQAADLHAPSLNQILIHHFASTEYDHLIPRVVTLYRARRDAMLAALETHMPPGVTWTRPQGGMFTWLTLPAHMDATALLPSAFEEYRIAYVPGAAFHPDSAGRNTLRLNYSLQPEPMIAEGMARLGSLLRL